jgi:hypothetical protein
MTHSSNTYDVIILGGGAAGLMCAIEAGNRGRRVLLIEHNESVGKKIRISGGGRCNFTNLHAEPACYYSENPRFCYSALARYTPRNFIGFVERHDIAYHERKHGQLFCGESAQQIIDALVEDCRAAQVEIRVGCTVREVAKPDGFIVRTTQGEIRAAALVVATGGLSIPKLGATDFGYQLAKQFEIPIIPCAPGLVPFTLNEAEQIKLPGISFDARVTTGGVSFDESVLFTHRGLSGLAILQASSYWVAGEPVFIDLFPGVRLEEQLLHLKREDPKLVPKSFLNTHFSERFAKWLCVHHGWDSPLGEMSDNHLRGMAQVLQQWKLVPAGTEGYGKAEVTCGGVDTKALSPKTMESRHVPGLYFIGEVMDVTGWLGGFNFQWAWASAVAAGRAL